MHHDFEVNGLEYFLFSHNIEGNAFKALTALIEAEIAQTPKESMKQIHQQAINNDDNQGRDTPSELQLKCNLQLTVLKEGFDLPEDAYAILNAIESES